MGLLAAIGGYWFGIGRYTEAPSLVAKSKVEAEAAAKQAGFKVRYGPARYDEKEPKDQVLSQEPAAGARIVSGGEVTLTLSLGPERYTIPDVIGKKVDVA